MMATRNSLPCKCCKDHRPMVMLPDGHHLWPMYLGGPEHPQTYVSLCQTTHANVHRMLRAMVKEGVWLPRSAFGTGVSIYAHKIATLGFQAWDAAGRPTK